MKVKDIVFSKINPRRYINEKGLQELADSIKKHGVIEPVILRFIDGKHEVVCGERRVRAARMAGVTDINAVELHDFSDEQVREMQLIENLQREDLNPVDEAQGFDAMLRKFKRSPQDLASKVGKSHTYIVNRLKILKLSKLIQDAVASGVLMPGHGVVIARLDDSKDQDSLFRKIKSEKMSVRAAENCLDDYGRSLGKAPFDRKDCETCAFNGSKQKDLFDKATQIKGKCLKGSCYTERVNNYINTAVAELKKKGYQIITKKQIKGSYENFRCSWKDVIKDLGKHYKEKCLAKCPNHAFVISEIETYGPEKGLQRIDEICLNPKCMQALCRKKEGPKEEAQGDWKKDAEKRKLASINVDALHRFYVDKVSHNAKDRMIEITVLYYSINVLTSYGYVSEVVPKKALGKYDQPSIEGLYKLTDKEIEKLTCDIFTELVKKSVDDEDLKYFTEECGFTVAKHFVVDEAFLKPHTKDQIVKIAKQMGIDLNKIRTGGKKSELIADVLGSWPKGKVPKCITK